MITVCMATYNGEHYVRQQLASILKQLNSDDEVIVVDDCSQDRTLFMIKSFNDERIKVISNSTNIGPIKSFEKGLVLSHGEYIFLADQDDVWLSNKVSTVLNCFKHDKADLVVHYAIVVDNNLKPIAQSWNNYNHNRFGKSWLSTLTKNPFTGANMAFSRRVLEACVPFPEKIPMHDWWIGGVCQQSGFKISIINKSLLLYRRHNSNVTGNSHQLKKMLVNRIHFWSVMRRHSSGCIN